MLKLKQQQLQLTVRQVQAASQAAEQRLQDAQRKLQPYRAVLTTTAGVNVEQLAEPSDVATTTDNIAGVRVPIFQSVTFPPASYSLFATPAWVDAALLDLRDISQRQVELEILNRQRELLLRELTKIIQRVNLFEKVMIPDAQEAIRVIRIRLGDEMTAGVGRAKIAKGKLDAKTHQSEESNTVAEAKAHPPSDGPATEEAPEQP